MSWGPLLVNLAVTAGLVAVLMQGEDKRYASLLRRNRGNLAVFVLRYIYWKQGRVMWFVSLPVQAAMYEHAPLGLVS